jgi:aminomethyltransferase
MCQDDGGVVDDLFVMDMGDRYILIVNASNAETDFAWIRARVEGFRLRYSSPRVQPVGSESSPPEDREVTANDVSDQYALLALQGPRAEDVLGRVLGVSLSHIKYFQFDQFEFSGERIIVSRTGYTGEDGFEILLPPSLSPDLWRQLLELDLDGKFVMPCGLGSRDSLRLEMGYSLYGHELSLEINPYEAGVGFAVRLDKGEFIGGPALSKIKASGPGRRTIALQLTGRGVPRAGDRVSLNGEDIGHVTSGGYSPILERGIALALAGAEEASALQQAEQSAVSIEQRQRSLAAQVVKLPFVPSRVKR